MIGNCPDHPYLTDGRGDACEGGHLKYLEPDCYRHPLASITCENYGIKVADLVKTYRTNAYDHIDILYEATRYRTTWKQTRVELENLGVGARTMPGPTYSPDGTVPEQFLRQ